MPSACVVDRIHDGQQALRTSRSDDARAAFEDALAADDTPDARDGLGQALWFQSHVAEGIAARERAFEGYARERRCDEAARVAVWISHQYSIAGRGSAARGWLARAERAVEALGPCAGHGWVALLARALPLETGVTSTEASADATQVQRSKPLAARLPAELGLLRPRRRVLLDEAAVPSAVKCHESISGGDTRSSGG